MLKVSLKCERLKTQISAWYNAHRTPIHVATHVDFVLHAVDVVQVVYNNIKRRSHKRILMNSHCNS